MIYTERFHLIQRQKVHVQRHLCLVKEIRPNTRMMEKAVVSAGRDLKPLRLSPRPLKTGPETGL